MVISRGYRTTTCSNTWKKGKDIGSLRLLIDKSMLVSEQSLSRWDLIMDKEEERYDKLDRKSIIGIESRGLVVSIYDGF